MEVLCFDSGHLRYGEWRCVMQHILLAVVLVGTVNVFEINCVGTVLGEYFNVLLTQACNDMGLLLSQCRNEHIADVELPERLRKIERSAAWHILDRLGSNNFIQSDMPDGTYVVHGTLVWSGTGTPSLKAWAVGVGCDN